MAFSRTLLGLLLAALFGSSSLGQSIQLPTFGHTTVSTTVSVPDGGQALLGGVNTSSSGQHGLGTPLLGPRSFAGRPFGNRAIGGRQSAGVMSIRATIHDFESMDQALLAQAKARRAQRGIVARGRKATRHWLDQNPAARSVSVIRRQPAEPSPSAQAEMEDLIARAKAAEAKGKPKVARIFYRMLARDATGDLKAWATAKIDLLDPPLAAK